MPAEMTREAAARIMQLHDPDTAELRRKILQDWIKTGTDPNVRQFLIHQFDCEAKYFRPLTIFSCHRAVTNSSVPASLLTSAQVVEMFHNVTLIIDDIVDRSDTRRGKDTMWKYARESEGASTGKRGNGDSGWRNTEDGGKLTAYMVAGYIIADGYDILARGMLDEYSDMCDHESEEDDADSFEPPKKNAPDAKKSVIDKTGLISRNNREALNRCGPVRYDMRLLSELVKRLAIAECVQWKNRKTKLTLADWHYLAREDTGSMFEICAALGARSQRLRRFGRLLGMLYHGCDDVADLRGAIALGGGGDEDLEEGILTLPAALAIQGDDRIGAIFCKNTRSKSDMRNLRHAFEAQLDASERELNRLKNEALEEVEKANLRAPEYLLALVTDTRKLSGQ